MLNSPPPSHTSQPTGTITFLFTDIEGSTKRWERSSLAMHAAFARQEAILRQAIKANQGHAYKMIGDAFRLPFPQLRRLCKLQSMPNVLSIPSCGRRKLEK